MSDNLTSTADVQLPRTNHPVPEQTIGHHADSSSPEPESEVNEPEEGENDPAAVTQIDEPELPSVTHERVSGGTLEPHTTASSFAPHGGAQRTWENVPPEFNRFAVEGWKTYLPSDHSYPHLGHMPDKRLRMKYRRETIGDMADSISVHVMMTKSCASELNDGTWATHDIVKKLLDLSEGLATREERALNGETIPVLTYDEEKRQWTLSLEPCASLGGFVDRSLSRRNSGFENGWRNQQEVDDYKKALAALPPGESSRQTARSMVRNKRRYVPVEQRAAKRASLGVTT